MEVKGRSGAPNVHNRNSNNHHGHFPASVCHCRQDSYRPPRPWKGPYPVPSARGTDFLLSHLLLDVHGNMAHLRIRERFCDSLSDHRTRIPDYIYMTRCERVRAPFDCATIYLQHLCGSSSLDRYGCRYTSLQLDGIGVVQRGLRRDRCIFTGDMDSTHREKRGCPEDIDDYALTEGAHIILYS